MQQPTQHAIFQQHLQLLMLPILQFKFAMMIFGTLKGVHENTNPSQMEIVLRVYRFINKVKILRHMQISK